MSQTPALRTRHLESSQAAEFFVSPNSSRHLGPFLHGECSLAEAAKALGLSKSRMGYWLNKLLELGLIEQLRIEKRGKHHVPIYRATADVFTVPFDQIPAESGEQVLEIHARGFAEAERMAVIRKAREHAEEWYLEYRLWNGQGQRNFVPKTGRFNQPPFILSFGTIYLTDEVAEAAKQELQAFVSRYGVQNNPRGKGYLFKFLIVEEVPS
jgi:DNA-binding transcriptional ArsR family regulator